MSDSSTFDRLVSELSKQERQELLHSIESNVELRDAPSLSDATDTPTDLDEEYRRLEWWRRVWLWIRALIAAKDRYELMKEDALQQLLQDAERRAPEYVRAADAAVTQAFIGELDVLRKSSIYFSAPLAQALGKRKVEFYALLAGLEVPDLRMELLRDTDPFLIAEEETELNDYQIKQRALQNLDQATTVIPGDAAEHMEHHSRLLAALHALCEFDFAGVGVGTDEAESVKIAQIEEGLKKLAGILHALSLCWVSVRPLEALVLFTHEDSVITGNTEQDALQHDIQAAKRHIEAIFECTERLPLKKLASYAAEDVNYSVAPAVGPEAWKELVKSFWMSRIDALSALFRIEQEIRAAAAELEETLGVTPTPMAGYPEQRPTGRGAHALSLGVCEYFAESLFPRLCARPLHKLLIDGEFYKEENRQEFNEAYTVLTALGNRIAAARQKVSPDGELQRAIKAAEQAESHRARVEQINAAVKPLNQEAQAIVQDIVAALRSMSQILYGILYGEVGGKYDTLSNLGQIGGREHESLMKQFDTVLSYSNALVDQLAKLLDAEEKLQRKL